MFGVFFAHLFYSEVIDDETEADGSPIVDPQSWRVVALVISMFSKFFFEEVLGNDPSVR